MKAAGLRKVQTYDFSMTNASKSVPVRVPPALMILFSVYG